MLLVRWLVLSGSLLVVALALACGGDDDDTGADAADSSPAATTAAASPTVDVAALTKAITTAYEQNRTFVPRASTDDMKVAFDAASGTLTFDIRPLPESGNTIGGNSKFLGGPSLDTIAIAAQSAVVAGKVTWKDHPEVKRITVNVIADFALRAGGSARETGASITFDRATGEKLDFEALKTSVAANGRTFFCQADAYRIHVVTWGGLADKGCMTAQTKGS